MEIQNTSQLLKKKGLKKTKLRLELINHFIKVKHAQSYTDLKQVLVENTDKSTLYRNLAIFEQVGLIHRINDNSGISKYALGASPSSGNEHAHFVCESCEAVYCLEKSVIIKPNVPGGFKTRSVQTIVKGVCANC